LGYILACLVLRKMEALHLRPWDVDLGRRTVTIHARATWRPKTRASSATLPLADPVIDVLELWLPRCGDEFLFPGTRLKTAWTGGVAGTKPLDEIKAAGKAVGIPNLTILSFRKTIGTLAKSWGLGPLEVQAILRHTSVKTQEWYDEEDVEVLRLATSKIRFG
jgi:integrase